MNIFKTTLLLGAMTGMLLAVGSLFGNQGLYVALGFATLLNIGSYWFSDKIVLRMYRAEPATPERFPVLHRVTERLVARAGMPKPALYVLPTPGANAFATGRNPQHGAVAVTQDLLRMLDEQELEGVVAHELAHIRNRDILTASIAATLAGAVTIIARMLGYSLMFGGQGGRDREGGGAGALAMMILAPLAAMLIQMAVSRTREYAADATGARMAGHPFGLIGALQKLEASAQVRPTAASPTTAHMFIVQPLAGLTRLFSTHPPMQERIRRLREVR